MTNYVNYSVATGAQLNSAIDMIDAGGSAAAADTDYTIVLTSDLQLSSNLAVIDLLAGDGLTITGNSGADGNSNATVDGGGSRRGFVVRSGDVHLDDLVLEGLEASGGAGASGAKAGGGGAGLGGAVFVASGATVELGGDQFVDDGARGGAGGTVKGSGVGAGGAGEPTGFGAGGAGGVAGGFGGGGGTGAAGGFGAGANAGGGLGAGGNVFVQQGGVLTISGGVVGAGAIGGGAKGTGGAAGSAYGSGLLIQGDTTVTLKSGAVSGVIADQSGSGGAGANAGVVDIAGPVTLSAHNTYTGGTVIESGDALTLGSSAAAGAGAITFAGAGVLDIKAGVAPKNLISGLVPSSGAVVDLNGVSGAATATLHTGDKLVVTGASGSVTLNLDPAQSYAADSFYASSDSAGGTDVTAIQTTFSVSSEATLNAAIAAIDVSGAQSRTNTAYRIDFVKGFTLGSDLDAINLAAGDSLTIDGAGASLNGGGAQRGFFVYSGAVEIENLTIADAVATGGAGGAGAYAGGGGAGLGGGLFVASAGRVTLSDVKFAGDGAVGGAAGGAGVGYGGGGGLGGAGGAGSGQHAGGGGGVGPGATGGTTGAAASGGSGIILGAGGGSTGDGASAGAGGANGGGGGAGGVYSGSGRDPRSFPGPSGTGGVAGAGSFGGGAGSGEVAGFGGGGSTSNGSVYGVAGSANGGWGGGAAAGGTAGFGGGAGGGGLGAGGAVFVQQGGSITIEAGTLSGDTVAGGAGGGGTGSALGSGLFLQGDGALNLAPGDGQTLTIADSIADEAGNGGTAKSRLYVVGAGTVDLTQANTFSGGVYLSAGDLSLMADGAAGSGVITFEYGHSATLTIGAGDLPANVIAGLLPGDTIDLRGIGTATQALLGTNDVLTVSGGSSSITLHLSRHQSFVGEHFHVASDGHGGTLVTAIDANGDQPPHIVGGNETINGADDAPLNPLGHVTVADVDTGALETVRVALSSTANGTLSNLGGGTYNAASGVYTVTGSASAVTAALDGLVFDPVDHEVAPGLAVTTAFAISASDGTMSDSATNTAVVVAQNTAPAFANVPAPFITAYFTVPLRPLADISVIDPDVGAKETVTIGISGTGAPGASGDAYGQLSLATPVDGVSLTETAAGSGVYTLTAASPKAETAALRALTFTPSYFASGYTITTLGLSVTDGTATTTTSTSVEAGAPVILGALSGQTTSDVAPIDPFASVKIKDSPEYASDTLTITVTDANEIDTDADGSLSGAGLTKVGVGIYELGAATPSELTKEIDALSFTPTQHQVAAGDTVTTNFEISVFNGATTSDNYATSVVATGTSAAVALFAQAMAAMPAPGAAQATPLAHFQSQTGPNLATSRAL
jgi:plastocyanin